MQLRKGQTEGLHRARCVEPHPVLGHHHLLSASTGAPAQMALHTPDFGLVVASLCPRNWWYPWLLGPSQSAGLLCSQRMGAGRDSGGCISVHTADAPGTHTHP